MEDGREGERMRARVAARNEGKRFGFVLAVWVGAALFAFAAMEMFLGGTVPFVLPVMLALGAAHVAFFHRTRIVHGTFLKRGVALLLATFAVWLVVPDNVAGGIPWQPYAPELLDAARRGNKPVMIDFRAAWCGPCKDMDRNVFARRKVVEAAAAFLALQADLTRPNEQTRALAEKFHVEALPTVVFLAGDGSESANLRLVGYERAEDFLRRLQQAK